MRKMKNDPDMLDEYDFTGGVGASTQNGMRREPTL